MLTAMLLMAVLAAEQPARLAPFEQAGLWGYRDRQGRVVIQPRWIAANPFSTEGIAAVADEQGWSYIDRNGRLVIRPYVFDNGPDYFAGGLARFTVDGKFGFFDKRGRVAIAPRFTFAGPFSESRAAVCEGCRETAMGEHRSVSGGKWGYIDRAGVLAIAIQFEDAEPFEKGRARVKLGGQWKYIDKKGAPPP